MTEDTLLQSSSIPLQPQEGGFSGIRMSYRDPNGEWHQFHEYSTQDGCTYIKGKNFRIGYTISRVKPDKDVP